MVIPLGLLKAGEWTAVSDDVAAVRAALGHSGTILKAIIEAPLLADSELERAARTVVAAGAQFVKTGTGFSGPALPVHVMKIRQAVGDTARIKAAGGIRDAATARALLEAGADRLGASHAAELLADFARSQG
jgi:deoxyribose-phosphate aldolase